MLNFNSFILNDDLWWADVMLCDVMFCYVIFLFLFIFFSFIMNIIYGKNIFKSLEINLEVKSELRAWDLQSSSRGWSITSPSTLYKNYSHVWGVSKNCSGKRGRGMNWRSASRSQSIHTHTQNPLRNKLRMQVWICSNTLIDF